LKSHFLTSLESLEERAKQGPMTFGEIFDFLGGKGDEVLLIFLCLPFLQPVPIPFLSTLLGLLVCGAAIFSFFNQPPWMPKKFRNKAVDPKLLLNTVKAAEKIWSRVEKILKKILKPRWPAFSDMLFFKIFNVLLLCTQGLLLSLPLPIPFSNTVPAIAIILNAIGQLEEDGLVVLLSYLVFLGSLSFFSGLAVGVSLI
jgi:hypothetical protein